MRMRNWWLLKTTKREWLDHMACFLRWSIFANLVMGKGKGRSAYSRQIVHAGTCLKELRSTCWQQLHTCNWVWALIAILLAVTATMQSTGLSGSYNATSTVYNDFIWVDLHLLSFFPTHCRMDEQVPKETLKENIKDAVQQHSSTSHLS